MSSFDIELRFLPNVDDDLRALAIHANQSVLTRLLRQDANQEDDAVQVPITPFAFWLADHWWRLRWECRPLSGLPTEWRQAHELAGIGGGYSWPRVTIWGEGERVVIVSKADPVGVIGPVRFLQNFVGFVPGEDFEAATDHLFASATDIAVGDDRVALSSLIEALSEERTASDTATWRRMEAINGFDPDQAPERLIESLLNLAERFTLADVEEAAAAQPGNSAASTLETLVGQKSDRMGIPLSFREAVEAGRRALRTSHREPWQSAEAVAAETRRALGVGKRPLRNKTLSELVGIEPRELQTSASDQSLPYGLRIATRQGGDRVLLQAHWGHDRRFELMRSLGDAIWTGNSPLGPVARSGTARQKFQRAFAASLLCPPDALRDYLQTDDPTDEDISEAARHFHVAEKTVRTILVNKRFMERDRLSGIIDDLTSNNSMQNLTDSA